MKKDTTLEIIEQSDKVSLYSISFEKDRTTEFERFMQKYESEAYLNMDYQRIISALQVILQRGAFERYFRPEGSINDNVCALPIEGSNIHLYCLRLSDQILIVGNGGVKQTKRYQDDRTLFGYVMDLQKFDSLLQEGLKDGSITIEQKNLNGIEDKVFRI